MAAGIINNISIFAKFGYREDLPDIGVPIVKQTRYNVTSVLTTRDNFLIPGADLTTTPYGAAMGVILALEKIMKGEKSPLAIGKYIAEGREKYLCTYLRGDGYTEMATFDPDIEPGKDESPYKACIIAPDGKVFDATYFDTDHNCFGFCFFGGIIPLIVNIPSEPPLVNSTVGGNEVHECFGKLLAGASGNDRLESILRLVDHIYRRTGDPATSSRGISSEWLINGFIGRSVKSLPDRVFTSLQLEEARLMINGTEYAMPIPEINTEKSKPKTATTVEGLKAQYEGVFKLSTIVPEFPKKMKVVQTAIDIAETFVQSKGQVSSFLLVGKAGSGKSTIARQTACILGADFRVQTCHSDTDPAELTVSLQPRSAVVSDNGDCPSSSNLWKLKTSEEEIENDPVTAWEKLTGETNGSATATDCYRFIAENVAPTEEQTRFVRVYSPIVQTAVEGGVCEIQEFDTIQDPAVGTALNALLEEGIVTLPTGETIRRNPFESEKPSIYIFTANRSYLGCNELNQAVYDRIPIKIAVKTPGESELISRVKANTGFDDPILKEAIGLMNDLEKYCSMRGITDGVTGGYRALEAFALTFMFHPIAKGDAYASAMLTLLPNATQDPDTFEMLRAEVLEKRFSPQKSKKRTPSSAVGAAFTITY